MFERQVVDGENVFCFFFSASKYIAFNVFGGTVSALSNAKWMYILNGVSS